MIQQLDIFSDYKRPLSSEALAKEEERIVDPQCPIEDPLPNNPNKEDLRRKTETWLINNPHIYGLYKRFAHDLLRAGRPFSVKLITERIRWECYFEYNEEFKISNDYSAYIARKLARDIPELTKILKFKKTRW